MKAHLGRYPKDPQKPRKICIKIDKWDSWSAEETLAMIIAPLLRQLKETTHAYPPILEDTDCTSTDENHSCPGAIKWTEILDKIIWSMEEIANGEPNAPEMPTPTIDIETSEWTSTRQTQYNPEEMAKYHQDMSEYLSRVQKGCDLLGQFFRDLWD